MIVSPGKDTMMERNRRSYAIKLATPAFLAGANQQQPELRVPSIRGCLRWWFRLAEHGAGTSLEQIRKKESDLFGSTDKGQRLILRIRPGSPLKTESLRYRDLRFDHQYLWFPLRPEKNSIQPIARPALAAGTTFKLEAIVPPISRGWETSSHATGPSDHQMGSVWLNWYEESTLCGITVVCVSATFRKGLAYRNTTY